MTAHPDAAPRPWLRGRRRLAGLGVLTCVASLVSAWVLDRPAALWVQSNIGEPARQWFYAVSALADATWPVLAALAYIVACHALARISPAAAVRAGARGAARWGVLLIAGHLLSGAVVHAMKLALGRPRPKVFLAENVEALAPFSFAERYNAFPSGHSQSIWTTITVLGLAWPPLRPYLVPLACLIMVSRVALNHHWVADTLMGAFLGYAGAVVLKPLIVDGSGRFGHLFRRAAPRPDR